MNLKKYILMMFLVLIMPCVYATCADHGINICGQDFNCATNRNDIHTILDYDYCEQYCDTQPCTDTCSSLGYECGTQIICGVSTDCGTCSSGYECASGSCILNAECGNGLIQTGEECDDGNANDGDGCSSACTIETGWSCLGEPSVCEIDCTFTSASWSSSEVSEGTNVDLNVQGTNCDGETVSFEIWEDDLAGDDPVTTNPVNVVFNGNSATGTWTAEWQSDGIGEPEYYFIATLISTAEQITSSAPNLEVTKSEVVNCTNTSYCMDYLSQEECGSDLCEVAEVSVNENEPEITCGIGYSCYCAWAEGVCGPGWSVTGSYCGDNIINPGETCDGTEWGMITECSAFDTFTGGSLSCVNCEFDTSLCTGGDGSYCGDGIIDAGETCDGTEWGMITECSAFDTFTGGSLSCVNCEFDTSLCTGGDGFLFTIGSCFYEENTNNDDCEEGGLLYYASWIGIWTWGENNNFSTNPDGGSYVQDPPGNGWHYDPERKFEKCADGSKAVTCPTGIQVGFFGVWNFIIAVIILAGVYLIWNSINFKKKKTRKN